jgi:hypothetical protein
LIFRNFAILTSASSGALIHLAANEAASDISLKITAVSSGVVSISDSMLEPLEARGFPQLTQNR